MTVRQLLSIRMRKLTSTKGRLRGLSHHIRFIENDQLESFSESQRCLRNDQASDVTQTNIWHVRKEHLGHREALDLISDDVYTSIV